MSDMVICKFPKTWPEFKSLLMWLMLSSKEADVSDYENTSKVIEFTTVPQYMPGWNLIYIPAAGQYCGYIDVGFYATVVYLIGSLFYLADSIYMCFSSYDPTGVDDFNNPVVYLNTWAAITFVINAILCFIDWWLQLKQIASMNMYIDPAIPNKVFFTRIPNHLSAYYFYNNIFFMAAALVYVVQGIWPRQVQNYYGDFYVNFWGSLLYLCSGTCSLLEFRENIRQRRLWNLTNLKLFTLTWKEIDWFGWGDVVYVSLSLFLFIDVFVDVSLTVANYLYLMENIMFLLNSLAYFIGYILYMINLREDMLRAIGKQKDSPTPSVSSCSSLGSQDLESASCVELTTLQEREMRKKSTSGKNRKSPSHVVGNNSYKHNTSNHLFHLISDVDTVVEESSSERRKSNGIAILDDNNSTHGSPYELKTGRSGKGRIRRSNSKNGYHRVLEDEREPELGLDYSNHNL